MRLLPVLLLAVLLAGCSGGSEEPRVDPTPSASPSSAFDEAAVREGLSAAFAGSSPSKRESRAGDCIAEELVGTATPEQLDEAGLLTDDGGAVTELPPLPDEMAGIAADATLACVDVVQASTRAVTSVRKGDLDPKVYADCLATAVPPPAQREALVATLAGKYDDPAVTKLGQAQADCAAEQG